MLCVLDYGSQYTQLIARRLRSQGFFTQVLPGNLSPQAVAAYAPDGIILSGSPRSVGTGFDPDPGLLSLGVPVLGLCFGYQFMAQHLGGRVEPSTHREYAENAFDVRGGCGFSFGNGCSEGSSDTSLFGGGGRRTIPIKAEV